MPEAESLIIDRNRNCKDCGVKIGKSKQFCPECKRQKRLSHKRANAHKMWVNPEAGPMQCPAAVLNFRRDESGNPVEKRCTRCDTWKAVSDFPVRKDTPSGTHAWCRHCNNAWRKEKTEKSRSAKDHSVLRWVDCKWCKSPFIGKEPRRVFCSDECKREEYTQKNRIKSGAVMVSTTALCRRCGEIKPLNQFKKGQADFGCKPTACNECKTKNKQRHKAINARNPKNKPRQRLSKRFHEVMSKVKNGGNDCFRNVIGCSTSFLRKHLESQFKKGIKWSNYGKKWHVDHILPVASFDHTDPNQVAQCWHYSNLRPLCAIENGLKSDKIVTCQPELLLQLVDNQ